MMQTVGFFVVGLVLGVLAGYVIVTLMRRRRAKPIATLVEYWVYLPGDKLPAQDELMADLAKAETLGHSEMLLFSDIRLHVALVLRSKNPTQFRPDLLEGHIEPTAEILASLSEANAMARIRFVSEKPMPDDRHLHLLPYLAYALAKRGAGKVIYDSSSEWLMTIDDLANTIKRDRQLVNAASHTRVLWKLLPIGGRAETRGLVKRGMAELQTLPVSVDQRVLVTQLMEEASKQVWALPQLPATLSVTAFDDDFEMLLGDQRDGFVPVRIARMHAL
jgi:hypothetical protein